MRKIDIAPIYCKYKRMAMRLKEVKGELKNEVVWKILCSHFIDGISKETLVEIYTPPGGTKTYVERILARHQGKDSCRRPDIRDIFRRYMLAIGEPDPFEDYEPPPDKLRKPRGPQGPTLGLF